MSRFGSTITDSDSKILNGLFNPYEWYYPSPKMNPQFEQQSPFGQPFGGKIQGLQSQFQQQKPLEQQALQQQGIQQQFQQPMQQLGADQQFQQPLQQKEIMQQQFQQPLQQQGMQQQFQQPLQQQFQQPFEQQGMQQQYQQQFQQPLEQGMQQQYQQPLQQQQYFPQQLQQDQFQQPLQQQGVQQFQQPMQQPGLDQQFQQPLQQKEMIQPSEAAFQQGLSTFMGKGPQQFGFFPEMPATVFFEIRDIDRVGGKEKKFYEEKHKGKRIPIVDVSGTSRDVSYMQGNWNEWQKEAQKCIDKILKLNYKAYNHFQQFQNFKLIEGGINYQNDVDNWMNRLKKNLDNLMKENERLRAELPSGNWGSKSGFQGVRGGVDLQVSDAVDSSHVIKPSDIKKSHITSEKVGQWHPQQEKHTFTDKVKDTAIGIATTVENAALHPIESVGKIASSVEQAALHPILTVEKAADAVVHTVI